MTFHFSRTEMLLGKTCSLQNVQLVFVINFLVTLLCTLGLLIQCNNCVQRWLAKETSTITSVKHSGDATFVAFTLCPSYFDAYNESYLEVIHFKNAWQDMTLICKIKLQSIGLSKGQYKAGNFFGNASTDGFAIFDMATFELNEVMQDIVITTSITGLVQIRMKQVDLTRIQSCTYLTIGHLRTYLKLYLMVSMMKKSVSMLSSPQYMI